MRTLLLLALASATATVVPAVVAAQTSKPAPKAAARPVAKPVAKPAPATAAPKAATAAPKAAAAPKPAPQAAAATDNPFDVGTNAVNIGIGLGNRYGYGSGLFGGSSSVSPALSVSFERGIIPLGPGVLGVGAFVGYQGASYSLGGGDKFTYTDVIVTLRGAFHYPVMPKFDAYGGLSLGVRRLGVSFSGPSGSIYNSLGGASSTTEAATNLFVGGRYYFTPNIGAFAELGYDQTYLKVGLTAKF